MWQASLDSGHGKIRRELEAGRVAIAPQAFRVQELDALPAAVKRYVHAVLHDGQPIIAAASF